MVMGLNSSFLFVVGLKRHEREKKYTKHFYGKHGCIVVVRFFKL